MEFLRNFLSYTLVADAPAGAWQITIALLAAYAGGVLSSLTPCVYPMIPITVGVVTGMGQRNRSWGPIILLGVSYVLGMAIVYSSLGVLAGLTGRIFGSFTNTPAWYLILGSIVTIASLAMMEVITFDPAAWWNTLTAKIWSRSNVGATMKSQETTTTLGAFFLGLSSGFIAAPCTTPVLAAILAYIAKTKSVGVGMALMFSFSLGLGTLLIVVAAFAGILALPRSGKWLRLVKLMGGVILLIFGEYLIYQAGRAGG